MEHLTKNFTAKKSLGQNFLHAPHIVGKMVHAIEAGPESVVLEVGPGKGVLTEGLLASGATVVAVEKDDRAIPFLQEKFQEEIKNEKLILIHDDILVFDPAHDVRTEKILIPKKYSVAANIPYYITGEFLRKFLESDAQPQSMVLMLQKEVAKRITDTKESILSISVKAYGTPKYITTVPARNFRPVPNVDSAVLFIGALSKRFFDQKNIKEGDFFKVVKAGFSHKRKMLSNNLRTELGLTVEMWKKVTEAGFTEKMRAEEVTLDQWGIITAFIAEHNLL